MSWRVGLASGVCLHRPLVEMLPTIAASGAVGLEIGTPPGHFHPDRAEEVAAVATGMALASLTAISVHAPFGRTMDLASSTPREREEGVQAACTSANAILRLGGRLMVVHPSDLERYGEDIEARLWAALDSLQRVADHARAIGVTVALETPLPHLIGGDPEEFRWLVTRLPRDVAICLDTGHAVLGRNWTELLGIADGRLAHVHASDNHGVYDDHLPPGDGTIDWGEITTSLSAVEFRGWIMLELHAQAEGPGALLTRAFSQAERIFAHGQGHS